MKKRIWLIAALCLCLLLAAEIFRSNFCLTVDRYEVRSEKITAPVRVVQLTDLHNAQFGRENEKLIARVAAQDPDLILFTGDLVTQQIENTSAAQTLLEKLVQIAPVYVSLGNHEQGHEENFGTDLTVLYEKAGAEVLEFSYEDVEVNGQMLRIGGISGYCLPEEYLSTGEANARECEFLRGFQATERCTILMCHMPACWIVNNGISAWDADLVFSGHVHGGQIEIPGIGGVYGPDMGFFPGRLEGMFPSDDGERTLVLSRGLGNSVPIPRLNNPPQILVLDILPEA